MAKPRHTKEVYTVKRHILHPDELRPKNWDHGFLFFCGLGMYQAPYVASIAHVPAYIDGRADVENPWGAIQKERLCKDCYKLYMSWKSQKLHQSNNRNTKQWFEKNFKLKSYNPLHYIHFIFYCIFNKVFSWELDVLTMALRSGFKYEKVGR